MVKCLNELPPHYHIKSAIIIKIANCRYHKDSLIVSKFYCTFSRPKWHLFL